MIDREEEEGWQQKGQRRKKEKGTTEKGSGSIVRARGKGWKGWRDP